MPELTWIGKDKVVNHHHDVPFRILEKQYIVGDDGSGNKIIHGDNLKALKALLPTYAGRVKCIYIDPPYNTGNDARSRLSVKTKFSSGEYGFLRRHLPAKKKQLQKYGIIFKKIPRDITRF